MGGETRQENLGAVGLGFWVNRKESGVEGARPGTEGGVESKCWLPRPTAACSVVLQLVGWLTGPVFGLFFSGCS